MPVYNSSSHLREAIDSILSQTLQDFEFLIFNDGSTDHSKDIILSYNDNRIKFFDDNANLGIANRLNTGLKIATGKYVARMDSDDIALPHRLEKQYIFMEQNENVVLLGSFIEFIEGNTPFTYSNWVKQSDHETIRINLLFDCGICHPTVMMRNDVIKKYNFLYSEHYDACEDYDLWVRISEKFQLANINDILLKYRLSSNQVSVTNNNIQRLNKFKIIQTQLQALNIQPTKIELRLHDHIFCVDPILSYDYLPKIEAWITKLIQANDIYGIYDKSKFDSYLNDLLDQNKKAFKLLLKKTSRKKLFQYYIKTLLKWNSIT